jgi:hypothetical protein
LHPGEACDRTARTKKETSEQLRKFFSCNLSNNVWNVVFLYFFLAMLSSLDVENLRNLYEGQFGIKGAYQRVAPFTSIALKRWPHMNAADIKNWLHSQAHFVKTKLRGKTQLPPGVPGRSIYSDHTGAIIACDVIMFPNGLDFKSVFICADIFSNRMFTFCTKSAPSAMGAIEALSQWDFDPNHLREIITDAGYDMYNVSHNQFVLLQGGMDCKGVQILFEATLSAA